MKWTISEHDDEERFGGCLYDSREEAIAQGRLDYHGRPFFVANAIKQTAASFLPDASDIIEMMATNAYDNCGECAEEWPDLPKSSDAEVELDRLLVEWAKRHENALECRFWMVENVERVEPEHVCAGKVQPCRSRPRARRAGRDDG